MDLNLVAVFYHQSQNLPIVMEITRIDKFFDCCNSLPTDWAYLYDKDTGKHIGSYIGPK